MVDGDTCSVGRLSPEDTAQDVWLAGRTSGLADGYGWPAGSSLVRT